MIEVILQGTFWANACALLLGVPVSTPAMQCSPSSQTELLHNNLSAVRTLAC